MLIRLISAALLWLLPACAFALVPVVQSNQVTVGATADDTARVPKPASLAAGDLVLVLVITANDASANCYSSSSASGLVTITQAGNATIDSYLWVGGKIATASEPDSYFVASACGADEFVAWSVRVTGHHPTNWLHRASITVGAGNSETHPIVGITTILDSCLAFFLSSFDGGDGDPFTVSGTGWTETTEGVSGTSTTTSVGGNWGTKSQADKGATGDATADATGTVSDGWSGCQFVIHGLDNREQPQIMQVGIQ